MRLIKTTYLVLCLAVLAISAPAIELEEYLELVKENHPFFLKEQLGVEVERSYRETLLPRYEWQYYLAPGYTIVDDTIADDYFKNLAQVATFEAGMERSFADGRRVGLSASTAYTWMQNPSISPLLSFRNRCAPQSKRFARVSATTIGSNATATAISRKSFIAPWPTTVGSASAFRRPTAARASA